MHRALSWERDPRRRLPCQKAENENQDASSRGGEHKQRRPRACGRQHYVYGAELAEMTKRAGRERNDGGEVSSSYKGRPSMLRASLDGQRLVILGAVNLDRAQLGTRKHGRWGGPTSHLGGGGRVH